MNKYRQEIIAVVSFFVGFLLLYLFYSFIGIKKVYSIFEPLELWHVIVIFCIASLSLYFPLKRWKIIVEDYNGLKLSWKNVIQYWLTGWAMTYLLPGGHLGGIPIKAYSLKKYHQIDWLKSLSSGALEQITNFFGLAVFAFLGVFIFILERESAAIYFLVSFILLIIFLSIFLARMWDDKKYFPVILKIIFSNKLFTNNGKESDLADKIQKAGDEMIAYCKRLSPGFTRAVVYSALYSLAKVLLVQIFLIFLNIHISWSVLIFAKTIVDILIFIPLPVELGLTEAAYLLTFSIFGLNLSSALAISFLLRFFDIFFSGLGFFFGGHITTRAIAEFFVEEPSRTS
jgi:uncharacterized protein (TIRG00374 family)